MRWKAATHVGEIGEPTAGSFLGLAVKAPPQKPESKKTPPVCVRAVRWLACVPRPPPLALPLVDLDSEARWRRLVDPWRAFSGKALFVTLPTSQRLNIWAACVCTILTSNWSRVYVKINLLTSLQKHMFPRRGGEDNVLIS